MANYKLLGEILEPLSLDQTFAERQKHIENLLCRYLNTRTVVAFLGAGTSRGLGYPSWTDFAKDIFNDLENIFEKLSDPKREAEINKIAAYAGTEINSHEREELLKRYRENLPVFRRFTDYIRRGTRNELSAQVMFGEVERILSGEKERKTTKQSKFFRSLIKNYFYDKHSDLDDYLEREGKKYTTRYNPYLALLELPIRRFVTTNYDVEIERALQSRGQPYVRAFNEGPVEEIIDGSQGRSFSQVNTNCKELARFPIAHYDANDYSVFHCHGRIDDISNCIITEEDYQKWYLRETKECLPFRQSFDLILDSNPILFIGYGLGDVDLMRWLRSITANNNLTRIRNPLFCLYYVDDADFVFEDGPTGKPKKTNSPAPKWKDKTEFQDECTALYLKYGLHIIPVYNSDYRKRRGDAICQKLSKIRGQWQDWWEGILMKPKFRKTPSLTGRRNYYHYKIDFLNNFLIEGIYDELNKELDRLMDLSVKDLSSAPPLGGTVTGSISPSGERAFPDDSEINFARRLAIVVGDGGTGKSWSVQRYLQKLEKARPDLEIVFWSSYYANDVLTGIDRLIALRDTQTPLELRYSNRFEKLEHILSTENFVIVFDGIEKLLNPNEKMTEGSSISPEVREFFKIISSKRVKARVILTSRLFPSDLLHNIDEKLSNEAASEKREHLSVERSGIKERIISAPKCWVKDLANEARKESVFTKLNREHLSEISSLVDGHIFCISLIRGILEDQSQKVRDLIRNIGNTPVDRRIQRVIKESIQNLDNVYFNEENSIALRFIERVSLFMHPIRREIAELCCKDVMGNKWDVLVLDRLLESLVAKSLLQRVEGIQSNVKEGFVVHPLVRAYIFEELHKSLFVSLPSLQLSGFTSSKEIVDPGSHGAAQTVKVLFSKLCDEAEKQGPNLVGSDMCRGAFSILRSRFCSNTVTRWGDYEDYLKMVLRLYDTAKKISKGHWKYNEPTSAGIGFCESYVAPLYPDELVWVYNEIGLVSISMGNSLNATALREQDFEISKIIDKDREGRYLFQSVFNMGTAYIYFGKLTFATKYLDRSYEIANRLENEKLANRVQGYIALVKYLRGNLEEADITFRNACDGLGDNPRARSVFLCFHGELLIKMGRLDEARDKIEQSRHLAEASHYPDLIEYARLANANILLKQNSYVEAQIEYQLVLNMVREKKLRRLEAAALSGMSRLANKLHDSEVARQRAVDALKIANEYSLCLHQTLGLIVLGKALITEKHQRDFGISCLETARSLAKSQGYFLRMTEAEKELEKLTSSYERAERI